MARRKQKASAAPTDGDLVDAVLLILKRKQTRIDTESTFNGQRYRVVCYRLNDAVPIRIDFMPITKKVPV